MTGKGYKDRLVKDGEEERLGKEKCGDFIKDLHQVCTKVSCLRWRFEGCRQDRDTLHDSKGFRLIG